VVKLDIPYRSQWDSDAADHNADCGPTCLAMILNYRGVPITPDGVYEHIPDKGEFDFTSFSEMMSASSAENVPLMYRRYADQDEAFSNLRANVDTGNAMIALVNYAPWKPITGNLFERGHFVVVTGYDDDHVYFHDPLFGLWKPREIGANLGFSNADFAAGWGGFAADENPNWACTIAGVEIAPQPIPQPQPKPSEPVLPPMPTPVAPTQPAKHMEDIERRIRALAAYRWAEAPDFDNEAELKLWLDNLGDWGLEYDEYVVKAGDTLAGVAGRFYGEQQRWHAIQIYNDLGREGLWLGETLLIPRHGQSNAQMNPNLPHDTTDFAKDLEFGMLIDPEQVALDYETQTGSTDGIGFVDIE
jgi:hypothetical protein